MSNLQKKFWQKRHDQLTEEMSINLQSLYTWALQLDDVCKRRNQWRADKKYVTGVKAKKYVNGNEQALAQIIIDFIITSELDVSTETTPKPRNIRKLQSKLQSKPLGKLQSKPLSKLQSKPADSDSDSDNITVDVEEGNMKPEDMKAFMEARLTTYEKQQDILAKHMDTRRKTMQTMTNTAKMLLAGQTDEMDALLDGKVKFNLTLTGEPDTDETEPEPEPDAETNKPDTAETNADDAETNAETNAEPVYHKKSLDTRENPVYKFAGVDKGDPDVQARNAPTSSPLLFLRPHKREELLYNLYKQATHNVESMMGNDDISKEKKTSLISDESDRLLLRWVENNSYANKQK